ncbi:hypothetical protein MPAR168_10905 [Methylorubrum populi]|uniref:Uncharacterized protein n=1 Tax=Methylobacterium radiotolerans TaxID=31998 RepID=A0ABU7TE77_9HYPH|nr:hypothetical protein [Methylobacterium sp. B4]PXW66844.1 hypothetical protein BY998_101405 [Methylobacterium sp. B4]
MTNRHMVKAAALAKSEAGPVGLPEPNPTPLPPMPAPEDSRTPATREEPIDSPHPHPTTKHPPRPGEIGLSTGREG